MAMVFIVPPRSRLETYVDVDDVRSLGCAIIFNPLYWVDSPAVILPQLEAKRPSHCTTALSPQ